MVSSVFGSVSGFLTAPISRHRSSTGSLTRRTSELVQTQNERRKLCRCGSAERTSPAVGPRPVACTPARESDPFALSFFGAIANLAALCRQRGRQNVRGRTATTTRRSQPGHRGATLVNLETKLNQIWSQSHLRHTQSGLDTISILPARGAAQLERPHKRASRIRLNGVRAA